MTRAYLGQYKNSYSESNEVDWSHHLKQDKIFRSSTKITVKAIFYKNTEYLHATAPVDFVNKKKHKTTYRMTN